MQIPGPCCVSGELQTILSEIYSEKYKSTGITRVFTAGSLLLRKEANFGS